MSRVSIPAALVEFDDGGNTLWVHGPKGATIVRIKLLRGKFRVQKDCENICSHVDMMVTEPEDVTVCLTNDAEIA